MAEQVAARLARHEPQLAVALPPPKGSTQNVRICFDVIRPFKPPAFVPKRRACTSRAAYTCSRIPALPVPSPGFDRSSNGTGGTSMCRSMRSSRGPLIRPMYFSTAIGAHLHAFFGSPRNPHGHGFIAAHRMKSAGNVVLCAARLIVTRPSSSG